MRRVLIIQAAAAGYDFLAANGFETPEGCALRPLRPVFPAVTCVAQATLRTALDPKDHGLGANGIYDSRLRQTQFWNQSSALVRGPRVWEAARARGARVGMYFFQQSLGESADELVSPAPLHTHGGGMIMATYQKPAWVMGCANPVPLWRYWGPLASPKAGDAIAERVARRIERDGAPEILFVYLPTLDYDLQRFGPDSPRALASLARLRKQTDRLVSAARERDYAVVFLGDYAIAPVTGGPLYPNRLLRTAGLMAVRPVKKMTYPDFHGSQAFALCDHQAAAVYAADEDSARRARAMLGAMPGVAAVRDGVGDEAFVLEAEPGYWFAYPWWEDRREAPDYATHVDIHNKPGFDPCELFFGRTPFSVSLDATRVRGTHGRSDLPVALITDIPSEAEDFRSFAAELGTWMAAE